MVDSKIGLFADVCVLYTGSSREDDVVAIQSDLNALNCWAQLNKMELNVGKFKRCKCILIVHSLFFC